MDRDTKRAIAAMYAFVCERTALPRSLVEKIVRAMAEYAKEHPNNAKLMREYREPW